jgi:hypothetical protein
MYFAYGTFTLSGVSSQILRLYIFLSRASCSWLRLLPATPVRQRLHPFTPNWFGLLPFRSPLLRESLSISFPPGTKMFPFPGFAPALAGFRVAPFGHPRIYARLQLPVAFRSLPRPSSPPVAKASSVSPFYLDLIFHYALVNELVE